MAKNKLPEGYRGVDKITKEFREKNPKGKIETSPVLLGDGYVIITAKITTDDGAIGSGMADADVQNDKDVEKAESGAIRRALLTLGYESIESDGDDKNDEKGEKEERSEKRSFRREEKEDRRSESARDADENEEDKKEEKPRSRFGNKNSSKDSNKKDSRDDADSEEEDSEEEGESKFKRGSRFTRS